MTQRHRVVVVRRPAPARRSPASSWYRISAVNGKSVKSVYGVTYLYSADRSVQVHGHHDPGADPDARPHADCPHLPRRRPRQQRPRRPTPKGSTSAIGRDTINWTKVAAAGKRFAFMKASRRAPTSSTTTYATNRQQARAAGLYVGAYHFAQPSTGAGDAIAEADHFIDTARPAGGDLAPRPRSRAQRTSLSQTALTAWVQAFLATRQ